MRIRIYPGQYYDAETGLHYNWHRYYDPATGRYLTPDPLGLAGGINLYAYVQNNPVNRVDPWGLVDLNLFPQGSTIYNYANKVQTNNYSVGAHGSPTSVLDQNGMPISPKELATKISKDPNYKPGTSVDLMSCQTGKTPESGEPYAKKLARELGADVNAPDTYDYYYSNGSVKPFEALNGNPATPDLTKPGTVHKFTP